jgi:hypothetical protein
MHQFIFHKQNFIMALKPFLEMLLHHKSTESVHDWFMMINNLEARIILDPEQYLGQDLPAREVIDEVINEIFEEFVRDPASLTLEATFVMGPKI